MPKHVAILAKPLSLTVLAMLAFAGNSLICRLALRAHEIDPVSFTSIRLTSGALVLCLICHRRGKKSTSHGNWISAGALFGYAAAFSFSYMTLSAGVGALILFGSVQVTMIAYGLSRGESVSAIQTTGLVVAFAGLAILCAPGLTAPSPTGAILMVIAGISWGVYSLRGRNLVAPTRVTAGNFVRAAPIALLMSLLTLSSASMNRVGVLYAVLSGALASGVGYAIWYAALRYLPALMASTVQLSVPVLAAVGAVMFLGESLTIRLVGCSIAILGGIALMTFQKTRQ